MFGREEKPSPIRLTAVQYLILVIFLVLAYGLWRLQVSQSEKYTAAAEQNRIRNVPILAPRGKIVDRNGRTIVDNYRSVTALLLRDSTRDMVSELLSYLHTRPELFFTERVKVQTQEGNFWSEFGSFWMCSCWTGSPSA